MWGLFILCTLSDNFTVIFPRKDVVALKRAVGNKQHTYWCKCVVLQVGQYCKARLAARLTGLPEVNVNGGSSSNP